MGIIHIDDLKPEQFNDVVSNFNKSTISEKLDGSNLIFGFDDRGIFFTSRSEKGNNTKFYKSTDYGNNPRANSFRNAHLALKRVEGTLKQVLNNGDEVEVEVLFDKQPNAIVYNNNCIVFIRLINSNDTLKIEKLNSLLNETRVNVQSFKTVSYDGINFAHEKTDYIWEFCSVPSVEPFHLSIDNQKIRKLRSFLSENSYINDVPNQHLLSLNLNKIPINKRRELLEARDKALTEFIIIKQDIKHDLVASLNNFTSQLMKEVNNDDCRNIGIEGVVLNNNNVTCKIVDKHKFTEVIRFDHSVRNQLMKTSMQQPYNLLGEKVDVINDFYYDVGEMLDCLTLYPYIQIKRNIKKNYQGDTIEQTLSNILSKNSYDFEKLKSKLFPDLINCYIDYTERLLEYYQYNWRNFQHTLKNGATIKYTSGVHERTLMIFAELLLWFRELKNIINNARCLQDIVFYLYKKQLIDMHES